jgi:AraC family transcriptional regulator of adaptative response/methylated-DNA-[protein]-cysteine methyltransferase
MNRKISPPRPRASSTTTRASARSAAQDPRWHAVQQRDSAAADRFVYAVRTTGVYAFPGSRARLPDPRNVEYFDSPAAAEAAGYRASRRADAAPERARARQAAIVAQACRRLAGESPAPGLNELAVQARLSPYHFHRVFKALTGLTPKGFAQAQRARQTREQLRRSPSVTAAIYDSGFDSNARFYAQSGHMLGMTPSAYRDGGADTQIHFAIGQTSLGAVLVAQSARGVCAISLGEDPGALLEDLQDRFPKARLVGADAQFEAVVARVVGLVEAPGAGLDLPLDLRGTVFQLRVWQALREVPPGSTVSYAELARRIGAPRAVRAVAGACGANPVAVAVPCHRVVRSDGGLSGYRWGVERKRELLHRESPHGF